MPGSVVANRRTAVTPQSVDDGVQVDTLRTDAVTDDQTFIEAVAATDDAPLDPVMNDDDGTATDCPEVDVDGTATSDTADIDDAMSNVDEILGLV